MTTRRAAWLIGAAVVVVALAAVAVLSLVGDDDAPAAAPPSTPASTAPATTAAPPSTSTGAPETSGPTTSAAPPTSDELPDDDERAAEIEAIREFVSAERGLPFLEDVPVEFLTEDEFLARLDEVRMEDVDEEERARTEELWKALRLIGPDDDLFELVDQAGDGGTLGFYETDSGRMVIRGPELTPLVRMTLAHELVHALDDQHFELDRDELDDDSEASFGFTVLVEGSAESVTERFEASLSDDEQDALAEETARFIAAADFGGVPFELLLVIQTPYIIGPDFVSLLLAEGGQGALDAAFSEPPTTGEQVFDFEAYLEQDAAVEIAVPPAPEPATDDGVFGALGLVVLFPTGDGVELATQWDGDRYVQWNGADGLPCVRVDLLAETDGGVDDYERALSRWADDHGNATVDREGDLVVLVACA